MAPRIPDLRWVLIVLGAAALSGCTPPVAPMVMACEDDYHPAMCMDGEEECETDDEGCRICTCVREG
jgi:hypothetical protein